MFKEFYVNISLVEALEQIHGYEKFMKDFSMRKQIVSYESTEKVHHYSVVAFRSLVEMTKDPRSFNILCTIRSFNFALDLCVLGLSINLMPLVLFKQLGLGLPKPTLMR